MYEKLAKFYDIFMRDVPYEKWADYLTRFLSNKKTGMDVGCGSGALTIALTKRGFDVVGCDISPEMLQMACRNAASERVKATFILQSAAAIRPSKPLDFITASCDVVNYLSSPLTFFKSAYTALKADGVLIFDISSEYKLRTVLGNNVFTDETDDVVYVWENSLGKNAVNMRLTFFEKNENGLYERSVEEQTQYIHTEEKLRRLLGDAGFTHVERYEFFTKAAPSEKAERIQFVAYREGKNG